jgi:hypothetical protein
MEYDNNHFIIASRAYSLHHGTGRVRYILQYLYTTWTRTLTTNILGPSLMGLRGTQVTGSIIYTLVNYLAYTNVANENCVKFCMKEVFKCRERRMMR